MRDYLYLHINGEPVQVRGPSVFQTLAGFLRSERRATGTKIVCDEGDCGACTVLIGRQEQNRIIYRPVNACIQHVYQLDRTHVVTVEGLAGAGSLNPVQESMVAYHGAQCGFCTPGFVVALTALFEQGRSSGENGKPLVESAERPVENVEQPAKNTERPEENRKPLTEGQIRAGLTGNLCRCTGYEPIIRAAQAVDPAHVGGLDERYPPAEILNAFANHAGVPVHVEADGRAFASPVSLQEAIRFKAEHEEAVIVQGGTDVGVWCTKRGFKPAAVLSLQQIADLDRIEIRDGVLEVGGSATLHALESIVRDLVPSFYDMLRLFGSPQIRHTATLAGNIANASPIADTLPFLYVTQAAVELSGRAGRRRVDIRSLFKGYKDLDMAPDEIITRILIPLPAAGETLRLYKVSKRRDLDISTFTAAFLMTRREDQIDEIRIAYGGVGPVVLRLPRTEAWLREKPFKPLTFEKAGELARQEIAPISDVRGSRDFRLLLAETILLKFYHESAGEEVYA